MRRHLSQVVKSFRLRLQIGDMSGQGLTNEGLAIIHVSDINNHAPQFSPTSVSPSQVSHMWVIIISGLSSILFLRLVISVQFHSSGKQKEL